MLVSANKATQTVEVVDLESRVKVTRGVRFDPSTVARRLARRYRLTEDRGAYWYTWAPVTPLVKVNQ